MIKESDGVLSKEVFFSAKESLSKILKTGLTSPLEIYEISKVDMDQENISLFYKNFTQYKSTVVLVNDEIRSVTFPINSSKIIEGNNMELKMEANAELKNNNRLVQYLLKRG